MTAPAHPAATRRGAAALLAALALAGCTTVSEYFGEDETAEPPAELEPVQTQLEVERLWSRDVGDGPDEQYLKLRPAVAGGRVYVADREGRVTAYDAATGDTIWSVETDAPASGGPGVVGDLVVFGTSEAEVIALDAGGGERRWSARVTSEVLAPPVGAGDTVVARTVDGKLFGLGAPDGAQRWVYDRSVPVLTLRGTSTPAVANEVVVAGFDSGRLVALALADGQPLWERRLAEPRGRSELERLVDIDADPVIADRIVYAVTFQGRLAALDLLTGDVLWQREMSSHEGLSVDARNVYVTDARSHVWALDRRSGASLWRQAKLQGRALTAPAVVGDQVVVADFEGYVHWLRGDDGRLVARTRVDDAGVIAPPVEAGGVVFVYDRAGGVTAFAPR